MKNKVFNYHVIFLIMFILFNLPGCQSPETQWQIAPNTINTKWAKQVNPENPLPEYPRPMMVREKWKNLNGLWKYAIRPVNEPQPAEWDGNILVPYPVESALSGVKKQVGKDSILWYFRSFRVPKDWSGNNILLHFEAVDWKTTLWVNGKKVGTHKGGYDPFVFDITEFLNSRGSQEIIISVWDPTDEGTQPRGKQVNNPRGIWYTPTTGIWQTVWLEPVAESYISAYKTYPDIDKKSLTLHVDIADSREGDQIKVTALFENDTVGAVTMDNDGFCIIPVSDLQLWTPENPNLYDLKITLLRNNLEIDAISGYFGMRKIAIDKDKNGITRMFLNNKFVFQNGPLDQGFWPDGIYTAPTDEALRYDIEISKELGFNMLRKHVKIESRRFYYWCDKLGILVWQDMPSGDKYIGGHDPDFDRTEESAKQFEYELSRMIQTKFNHPSIIMWVAFNEGWGQYETGRIVEFIKGLDFTRLVINASGWTDRGVGDVHDIHHYPEPRTPQPEENRAIVLGEFGGLGLPVENHTWVEETWGYRNMKDRQELMNKYEDFYSTVWKFKEDPGLSASVYTQITDVETETNGLLTYDREIIKLDVEAAYKINTNQFVPAPFIIPDGGLFHEEETVILRQIKGQIIRYTLDGTEPVESSPEYTGPIIVTQNTVLKAKIFSEKGSSRLVEAIFHTTPFKKPVYKEKYSSGFTAGGDYGLIDGERGTVSFRDGKWQEFEGIDMDVTIDFGEVRNITEINAGFLESTGRRIFLPGEVIFEVSEDGITFSQVGEVSNEIPAENREASIKEHKVTFYAMPVQYIRVFATNPGKYPDWYQGADGKSRVFIDEISWK
ncbi:Beta-galactosidase [subsurface metagenome]